jgi:hypothetical protein
MSFRVTCENKATAATKSSGSPAATKSSGSPAATKSSTKAMKMKKIADKPFISFTSAELRNKYTALPDGSIVENIGKAQKYIFHIDEIDEIDGFRTFKHDIPYESRTTEYESVIFQGGKSGKCPKERATCKGSSD